MTFTRAASVRLRSAGSLFAIRPVTDFAASSCDTSVGAPTTVKREASGPGSADDWPGDARTRAATEVTTATKRAGAAERDTCASGRFGPELVRGTPMAVQVPPWRTLSTDRRGENGSLGPWISALGCAMPPPSGRGSAGREPGDQALPALGLGVPLLAVPGEVPLRERHQVGPLAGQLARRPARHELVVGAVDEQDRVVQLGGPGAPSRSWPGRRSRARRRAGAPTGRASSPGRASRPVRGRGARGRGARARHPSR